MPNMRKMEMHNDKIEAIDKALRGAKNFLDQKVFFETAEGRKLLTVQELEQLRAVEVEQVRLAAQE
jgi:hypothetical protein